MKKIKYQSKSKNTRERIEEIKTELKHYDENIQLLFDFAEGRKTLKGGDYSDRAYFIKPTSTKDPQFYFTIRNLKLQIALLNREMQTLIAYGM